MIELAIMIDENELKDTIGTLFDRLSAGEEFVYGDLYKLYFNYLIDSRRATFFSVPMDLRNWIKDMLANLEVITPFKPDYQKIYDLAANNSLEYTLDDGRVIVAKQDKFILVSTA